MKYIIASLAVTGLLAVGIVALLNTSDLKNSSVQASGKTNVLTIDGKQIVEITVKGGYSPRYSIAKSGIPTVLRFKTDGVFDCSSALVIPSKKIMKLLPSRGVTDVDIGTISGGKIEGSCSMGMFPFEVDFSD